MNAAADTIRNRYRGMIRRMRDVKNATGSILPLIALSVNRRAVIAKKT